MQVRLNGITIVFNVADIEMSRAFYGDYLGVTFKKYDQEDGSAYLMTKIGRDVDFMIFKGDPKPGNTPNIVFGLADGGIDTLVERLKLAGIDIVTPVSEAPGGWFADFRDPDGQIISLYQAEDVPRRMDGSP